MSIKSKNNVKIIFKTILHILIFSIVSFIIFNLSFINSQKIRVSSGLFFSSGEYETNILIFIICIAVFMLAYTFFFQEYLKKDFIRCKNNNLWLVIVFIILFFLFIIAQFIIIIVTILLNISTGYVSNFPVEEIYMLILAYEILLPVFSGIYSIIKQK